MHRQPSINYFSLICFWAILGKIGIKTGAKAGAKAGAKTAVKTGSKIGLKAGVMVGAGGVLGLSALLGSEIDIFGNVIKLGQLLLYGIIGVIVVVLIVQLLPLFRRRK